MHGASHLDLHCRGGRHCPFAARGHRRTRAQRHRATKLPCGTPLLCPSSLSRASLYCDPQRLWGASAPAFSPSPLAWSAGLACLRINRCAGSRGRWGGRGRPHDGQTKLPSVTARAASVPGLHHGSAGWALHQRSGVVRWGEREGGRARAWGNGNGEGAGALPGGLPWPTAGASTRQGHFTHDQTGELVSSRGGSTCLMLVA